MKETSTPIPPTKKTMAKRPTPSRMSLRIIRDFARSYVALPGLPGGMVLN